MSDFYPLRVTHIEKDTRDSIIVSLSPAAKDRTRFDYIQGQYLTFKKTFDGEELRRSYSICSSLNDEELRVGIKRVEGGWFSTWANEELAVGDEIETLPPNGRFFGPLEPKKAKNYLMFAMGSGITPVFSLTKTILENEPQSKIILTYVNRSIEFPERLRL